MMEMVAVWFVGVVLGVIIGGAVAYDKGWSAGYNWSRVSTKWERE
jgi:hypothetical protein